MQAWSALSASPLSPVRFAVFAFRDLQWKEDESVSWRKRGLRIYDIVLIHEVILPQNAQTIAVPAQPSPPQDCVAALIWKTYKFAIKNSCFLFLTQVKTLRSLAVMSLETSFTVSDQKLGIINRKITSVSMQLFLLKWYLNTVFLHKGITTIFF